ncbi:glycosyltransferase family 4 protein [Bacillaceae bacterium Marseille-Q3522]|nr:glycosyltransferase family 4 protein [Bacillaceae bacterium Marseille-Q3522]
MKVLFCATVDYHFQLFHLPYLKWFHEQGWEVHVAASGNIKLPFTDKKYQIPIQRSPFDWHNFHAYQQLKQIINDNNYDIIHCHTPMGGVLTRLAAKHSRLHGTKVIYTSHGFHFYKGAPLKNWLFYYPIEKWLACYTDNLITINNEDYRLAVNRHFKASSIRQVHGVGVNTERFQPVSEQRKQKWRREFGCKQDDFLLIYTAEFNHNKNQKFIIETLPYIKKEVPQVKLLLAGEGPLLPECKQLARQLGVEENVVFPGYREDIDKLIQMSDVAVSASKREGLPVNIIEAMSCALPVVALENRGVRELIRQHKNGWYIGHDNRAAFVYCILLLFYHPALKSELGLYGRRMVLDTYSLDKVLQEKISIYQTYMLGREEIQWAIP